MSSPVSQDGILEMANQPFPARLGVFRALRVWLSGRGVARIIAASSADIVASTAHCSSIRVGSAPTAIILYASVVSTRSAIGSAQFPFPGLGQLPP